ncbi:MAG TPA: matrixin family metalloprotease [Dissulfurispiraceae bacterium]|nr:matrixin family metalloprotease [Dissulfurispiraceae bacterium]
MKHRNTLLFCIGVFSCFYLFGGAPAAEGTDRHTVVEPKISVKAAYHPVLRIPLRIHLGKSAWRPVEFIPVAEEISNIWLTQAGICFETEIVQHDRPTETGFDVWFSPRIEEQPEYNGLFKGEQDMHVRDVPILGAAKHPARSSTARTAAHEIGHALGLRHRQDSDDNLMRSKTYGWLLNKEEVRRARKSALRKALPDLEPQRCRVTIQYE